MIHTFRKGEVLVTDMTRPGLGADHEDRLGHRHQPGREDPLYAVIVSRELGIPW